MPEMSSRKVYTLIFSVAIFITCLVVSSITAQKLYFIPFIPWEIAVPVGTSLFALTFLSTDVLAEVFGKKFALVMVTAGFFCRVLVLLFLTLAVSLEPVPYFENQSQYMTILGSGGAGRIVFAGIVAYLISQFADVLIFDHFKSLQPNETRPWLNRLYLRNLASTSVSQFLDTVAFVVIAFGGVLPLSAILGIIFGQLFVKWLIAVLDTPFVYMIRNFALARSQWWALWSKDFWKS